MRGSLEVRWAPLRSPLLCFLAPPRTTRAPLVLAHRDCPRSSRRRFLLPSLPSSPLLTCAVCGGDAQRVEERLRGRHCRRQGARGRIGADPRIDRRPPGVSDLLAVLAEESDERTRRSYYAMRAVLVVASFYREVIVAAARAPRAATRPRPRGDRRRGNYYASGGAANSRSASAFASRATASCWRTHATSVSARASASVRCSISASRASCGRKRAIVSCIDITI